MEQTLTILQCHTHYPMKFSTLMSHHFVESFRLLSSHSLHVCRLLLFPLPPSSSHSANIIFVTRLNHSTLNFCNISI